MKFRAAIAGYGKMGKIRASMLKANPDTEVSYIFDPAVKVDQIDGLNCCQSFEDLLRVDSDLFFIAGYVSNAADYTIRALQAGKHVFCEKPPALSLKQIAEVEEVLNSSDKVLKYGFNHRYHYSVIKAKEIIESGAIGKILLMRGVYGKAGSVDFQDNWRNYRNFSGGGILMDQGIHMLDLFNHFSNRPLNVRSAVVKTLHWGIECEDNVMAILESSDDLICSLHSSATQWRHQFALEIIGELGYVMLDGILSGTMSYAPEKLIFGLRENEDLRISMGHPSENIYNFEVDKSWELELEEFVSAIKNGKPISYGTINQAKSVLGLVEKIYSFK
jgi:predicted dehydrogenase